jgi:hypothetical protein
MFVLACHNGQSVCLRSAVVVSHSFGIQGDQKDCAPDGYSTKTTQNYFKQFQLLAMIT